MPDFTFTTTVSLTPKRISDLFTAAIEGKGISYWCGPTYVGGNKRGLDAYARCPDQRLVWYAQQEFFDGDFAFDITFQDPDGDNDKTIQIDRERILKGLQAMANDDAGRRHLSDILAENEDSGTADVFVQFIVFGDIIFG